MINMQRAFQSERLMRALTGVTGKEFQGLWLRFQEVLQELPYQQKRERKPGAGRKHTLSEPEKLFFILFYLKCYPTFDLAAFFFEVNRAQTNRWVGVLIPVLEKVLKREIVLPKRRIRSMEEFLELFPEAKDIFIDGTERPIQRPKKPKKQRRHYSGKKKRHTKKNIVFSDADRKILLLGPSKAGKNHDFKLLQKTGVCENLPSDVCCWVDLGFQGIEKKTASFIQMPKKKPPGGELTLAEKEENRIISGIRILSEHAMAGIKRLKSVTDVYRNRRPNLDDQLMLLASGLWNYHLKMT